MKFIATLFAVILFSSASLFAQNSIYDSSEMEILDRVVVTAQYAPKTEKNAIYKVKVITAETIKAKAATNLTDVLRNELNVDLSFDANFGVGIELNGISKENVKLLIDGVPVIGRVNGVLDLNQINIDNLDRIEVIKGPVSVFYGTNAMGGTINLITKKNQNEKIKGNVNAYYESVGVTNIDGSVGYKFGKNIVRAEAGYYDFVGVNTNSELARKQNWPERNQYHTNVKYIRDINDFKLTMSSNLSNQVVHTLGEISTRSKKATDIDYTTRRWDNTLNFQGRLKNKKYLDLTASYLDYDRSDDSYTFNPEDKTSTLIENNPNANGNYFNTLFAKAQYASSNVNDKLNYVIGTEFQADQAEGNRILNEKQDVTNSSVFGSINYKLTKNIEIQPALRYTYNSSFNGLASPAINLKYKLNNKHLFRFAYGNGYRAPSLKELYMDWRPTFGPFSYTFTGNENLEVESSHNYNLYYTFDHKLSKGRSLQIEPSFVYNEIKNLIGLSELIKFERHYINLNNMKSVNSAIDAKYKPNDNLLVSLGVSYLGRYIEYTDEFTSDGFMFTPYVNTSVTYNYTPWNVSFNAFYKYSGERPGHFIEEVDGVDVLQESTRQDFSNLDLSVTKRFMKDKISLSIGGKNLFDVKDLQTFSQIAVAHESSIQFWGSTYFVQMRFNF